VQCRQWGCGGNDPTNGKDVISRGPIAKAKTFLPMTIQQTSVKRTELLEKIYTYFRRSLRHAHTGFAREYLESRGLNTDQDVGYNSGKLHQSKDDKFIDQCVELGLLSASENGYRSWAKGCLIFPLRNEGGQVVSFYGRSLQEGNNRHFYLKNRQGLYPAYPKATTKRLILCESVIDAASLEGLDLGRRYGHPGAVWHQWTECSAPPGD
jgi:DNA primase